MTKLLLVLTSLFIGPYALSADLHKDAPHVHYTTQNDTLTVVARGAPISLVMRLIALSTGLDVKIDPSIEKTLDIELKDKPLEPALRDLLRGYNTLYLYADKSTVHAPLLIAIRVLPNGVTDERRALAITSPEAEAVSYAQLQVSDAIAKTTTPMTPAQIDYLDIRWRYRVKQMPLDQRAQLEDLMERHKEFLFKQREKFQRMHSQAKNDNDQGRLATEKQEKEMSEADSRRYALREQRKQQLMQSAGH